jgi:hypothetical protein
MTKNKDLHKYTLAEVKRWADEKGLKPGKVKNTKNRVYFTKGETESLEIIDWPEFEKFLKEKDLSVWGTDEGWMKIFKNEKKP